MAYKSFKIIIDTNIWISFLIGKSLKGLQKHLDNESFKILTCQEQVNELIDVFNKPKIKKYLNITQIENFFDLFYDITEIVKITKKVELCRDKKDNYLLSLAMTTNADYLISGDEDLLILDKISNTKIFNYSDFDSFSI
jgi:putative PIN family toxin of toxin-antitoxin system